MATRGIPVLFSAEEIEERIATLALEIAAKMPPDVMIVSLLKGSFVFASDLIRALYKCGMHPQVDFMTLSSYGKETASSGSVTLHHDIAEDIGNRHVLILDDVLESGRTLQFAYNLLRERGASTLKIAVLLEKPGKRHVEAKPDFIGFTIPDKFVVGYGLDYANYYRELPYIGVLDIH